MNSFKRTAALLLAVFMILTMLPAGALADGEPALTGDGFSAEPAPASEEPAGEAQPEPLPADAPDEENEPQASEPASEEPGPAAEAPAEEIPAGVVPDEPAPQQTAEPASVPDEPAEELPAVSWDPAPMTDGDFPSSLYVNQAQRGWCTLASCTMMLRARMYLSGNDLWSSITQSGIYSSAWLPGSGVYFNWSYSIGGNRISVSHATISGISVGGLKAILDKHPEGIALYVYDVPHAIFVTGYDGNTFYGCDPAPGYTARNQPIGNTWLGSQCGGQSGILARADAYWYVSSYSISGTRWCTLSFDANGGSCSETSRSVRAGSGIGTLPTPTRRGWVFAGWYTSRDSGKQITSGSYVTSDTTLYAHWYAVSGTIGFSESPLTIRLYTGVDTASLTVTGTGNINKVRMEYKLEAAAEGKLYAAWAGEGTGKARTMSVRADPSASGTYHATFYMYDADTDTLVNQQQLTINVIKDKRYLEIFQTDAVFAVGSDEEETLAICYGGGDGDLPEGYEVKVINEKPEAVAWSLTPFDGFSSGLVIRPVAGYALQGPYPEDVELTIQLIEGSAVCSEIIVTVWLCPVSGICGGDEMGNVAWNFANGVLRITVIDPASDEGCDMWNFETKDGRAFWYMWADEIMRVEIGEGVTRIGSCAFYECTALRQISIADTVTEIGEKAFWGCISLQSADIPGSVSYIAPDAFRGCLELTELALQEGVSILSAGALDGCTALQTIHVPASMTDLQVSGDTDLQDVYFGGTRSQWDTLDADCSVTDKLPRGVTIHTEDDLTAADAARILSGDMFDVNGDNAADLSDAAAILQQIVGLQAGGLGFAPESEEDV